MRVLRRIIAALLTPMLIIVATVVGTVAAVLFTPSGHGLLARVATEWITGSVAGDVQIGEVRGNIWGHISLDRVVVHDQQGHVVVSAPHLEASYVLPALLAHRLVFQNVRADSLVLHLVKLRAHRWNYEQVFHLGEGPKSGTPPTVAFNDLELTNGSIRIDVPTTPGKPRLAASRNGIQPAAMPVDSSADGLVRVYSITDLNAKFRLLRISTPRNDPLLARITALRANVNDPGVSITQMAGQIVAAGDSVHFDFDSLGLPSSHLRGGGAIRWPRDTILSDFTLDAPRIALRDLRWIQPDFPDWAGRGHVVARSVSAARTDYRLDNLALRQGDTTVAGHVTVMVDAARGVGMRGLDMQLRNTPIGVLRPFLDTLPVAGALSGHLLADGFLDGLHLGGDLLFADALVAGQPVSHFRIDGIVHFGGPQGAVFDRFRLAQSVLALGTVRRLVPSMLVTGELRLTGQLDGAWRNANFGGTAEHVTAEGAVSRLSGAVRLDTRGAVLGLALDADFDPLSFDALRSGYPTLPARGALKGHVVANGTLDSLDINASMTGEVGTFSAVGRIKVDAPNYGADSLVVDMRRLDAEALLGRGSSTALNGRLVVRAVLDSGAPPRGTFSLALDRSRIGGATVDALTGLVHADRGLLTVDTGTVIWGAGRIDAHGTIGWAAPDSGTLAVVATAASLAPFDSLVRAVTGVTADTAHAHGFDGSASAALLVHGSLDAATVSGTVTADHVILDDWHAAKVNATLHADSLGRRFSVDATADTVGAGAHVADRLQVTVAGRADSMRLAGNVRMLALTASAGGVWEREATGSRVALDTMTLAFPRQTWRLAAPTRLAMTAAQVTIRDTFRLLSVDGNGEVRVSGIVPGSAPGKLDARVTGLALLDVFGVLQRDTTALDGWGTLDLHLAGTRDTPTFNGTASIAGPVFGTAHLPTVQATFDYAARRLKSNVSLWATGQKVLDGQVSLPLDLSLASRPSRKVPGELQISAVGDSVDMVILAAMTPSITNPTGRMSLNMKGAGTWAAPQLTGTFAIHDGGLTMPSLGAQPYGPINAMARFVADSMVIDSFSVYQGEGELGVKGGVRFENLTKPNLRLDLSPRDFLAMDVPGNMTVRATGQARLFGPLLNPVLIGDNVTLTRSVLYITDILTKAVIDLEDPENAALIDTTALRRQGLGNEFSHRFLDSLRIEGLGLHVGSEVWLRSAQANIQLEGDLVVYKDHKIYALTGLLNAPRGTYTLQVGGLIDRDFSIDQGTIQYFGTPDLNADVNIKAHHQVRTVEGDQFNVEATITGTMLDPKITLNAPGRNLSQRDLISYVLFGRSDLQVTGGGQPGAGGLGGNAGALALGALTSELRRSIVSGSSKLTTMTIRAGTPLGGLSSGSSLTQFAAGWQLGPRWFVTFDAGVCLFSTAATNIQQRNFGGSLEYRMSREFRIQAAGEPVQTCITNRAADAFTRLNRYQLGGDLLWQKDY